MIVYPAIDIRGGRAVRLIEGDFDRETAFDADPVDAACRWGAAGATWIHIVDLDGARTGAGANRDAIGRIRQSVSCNVQLGGGIRTLDDIDALLGSGIDRVILGSVAVTNPEIVIDAVRRHGDHIAVGLDARDGKLATSGWETQTEANASATARHMSDVGVRHIIFTDIRRDGTLTGPNVEALTRMVASTSASVIASGGIGSAEDVLGLQETGVDGVIVGRALYDGRIDLADLLARLDGAHHMAAESDARGPGSTRNSRVIAAPPEAIWRALTDPAMLPVWLAPGEMTAEIHDFDLRAGGGYTMSLYYLASETEQRGKTADREDRYTARYVEIVPNRRIMSLIRFDSSDPAFAGEMTQETSLKPEADGTRVSIAFSGIPSGIRSEDNEAGTESALAKLANLVEGLQQESHV